MLRGTMQWVCAAVLFGCLPLAALAETNPPQMVVDLAEGTDGAAIENVVTFGGALYFVADDGTTGAELWRSDGAAEGTSVVADIVNGGASHPQQLTSTATLLFFTADDGEHGRELWATDGSEAGSRLVRDIQIGGAAKPLFLVSFGSRVLFSADDGVNGRELWISDGTETGTEMVADLNPAGGSFPQHMTVYDGAVYFSASGGTHGQELWRTDGTEAGTTLVRDIHPTGHSSPQFLTVANNLLFFSAYEPAAGQELWKTDGTEAGTQLVHDINPAGQSFPMFLCGAGATLYFSADDGEHGRELWRSDGTSAGTALVCDGEIGPAGSFPEGLTAGNNGAVFFSAAQTDTDREVWHSDGTEAGTAMVKNIRDPGSSQPGPILFANGLAYFRANDQVSGSELWVSNGAEPGTEMVADINEGNAYSAPANCVTMNGRMYFTADDGTHGRELWALHLPGDDETPPIITLLGANPALAERNAPFADPGATAFDNIDGDITPQLVVTGAVNTSALGDYQLTYSVSDSSGNPAQTVRTVSVLPEEPPVLTLLGDNPLELDHSEPYVEPGFTATDNVDGDITAEVEVTGTVDPGMHGTYTLTYTVSDAAGHEVTADRTVVVLPPTGVFADIAGPSPALTVRGPVTYYVTYTNAAELHLSNALVSVVSVSGNASGSASVEITSGATATITLDDIRGEGALAVAIAEGSATGLDDSTAPAFGPSAPATALRDTDGDGFLNDIEALVGTNPNNAADKPVFWTFMNLFDAQGKPLYASIGDNFFTGDLDLDVLPDRYETALVAYVLTDVRYVYNGVAQDMFLRHVDAVRAEATYPGAVENAELVLAAMQMIGDALGGYWRGHFAFTGAYEVFLHTKNMEEPLTGLGDFDGDLLTNLKEYETVRAHGGGLWDFVLAATNATFNGEPVPVGGPWMLATLIGLFTVGAALRAARDVGGDSSREGAKARSL